MLSDEAAEVVADVDNVERGRADCFCTPRS